MTGRGTRVERWQLLRLRPHYVRAQAEVVALARDDQTAMVEAIAAEIEDDGPIAATAPVPAPWA
jgi:hypothetical protein